jgi:hypothetical protein
MAIEREPHVGCALSHVQGLLHMCKVGEGIAVGSLVRPGGIKTRGVLWTVDELATYLQRDGLQ